jgi:prefoldin subunit 5
MSLTEEAYEVYKAKIDNLENKRKILLGKKALIQQKIDEIEHKIDMANNWMC